jgi:hypothetical protein
VFLSAGKIFMVNMFLFLYKALFPSIRVLRVVLIIVRVKIFLFVDHAHEKAFFWLIFCAGQKRVFNAYLSA